MKPETCSSVESASDADETLTAIDMIAAIRGGVPDACDFCGLPYTEDRRPLPEEAGAWACNECFGRWQEDEYRARAGEEPR